MKRSVIISTAILLVVTALCLTAVTFSFFTTKSTNIEIDIDSLASNAFQFEIAPTDGKIYAHDASAVGEAKVVGDYIYCNLSYTTSEYNDNMFFTVKEFNLIHGDTVIERTHKLEDAVITKPLNESDYLAEFLEYQFVNTKDSTGKDLVDENGVEKQDLTETEIQMLQPNADKWKKERPFTYKDDKLPMVEKEKLYFNLGQLDGTQNQIAGKIRFYLRAGHLGKDGPLIDNELIPGNFKDCRIQVIIQAKQLS